jgi:hypothetical protein
MRKLLLSGLCLALLAPACDRSSPPVRSSPLAPAPTPPSPPAFPPITVGEPVRFRFITDDRECGSGRCRSYSLTAPSQGLLEVVLTSVSGDDSFVSKTEMYVVPGGDSWVEGPGPRISVTIPVVAGSTYEIRMFSFQDPSLELELRASIR